jgi:hypothetical protein
VLRTVIKLFSHFPCTLTIVAHTESILLIVRRPTLVGRGDTIQAIIQSFCFQSGLFLRLSQTPLSKGFPIGPASMLFNNGFSEGRMTLTAKHSFHRDFGGAILPPYYPKGKGSILFHANGNSSHFSALPFAKTFTPSGIDRLNGTTLIHSSGLGVLAIGSNLFLSNSKSSNIMWSV